MDLRVERTKRNIKEAFLKLRIEKPLEKITVKELAELAFINKATFYSHYKDIYDLSEQLENEIVDSIIEKLPSSEKLLFNPRENARKMALAISSQQEIIDTLFSGNRAAFLEHKLEVNLGRTICDHYPELKEDLQGKIILSMLVHGGFYIFNQYGEKYDVKEIIKTVGDINECLVENFIKVSPEQ